MDDDKIETGDLELTIQNCPICGTVIKSGGGICTPCLSQYLPRVKKFIAEHPGITYLGLAGNPNPPAPRNVIYELDRFGYIKVKN